MNINAENSAVGFADGSCQDELDFPFPLFLCSQTGNDIPHDDQDELDALSNLNTNPPSSNTDQDHPQYSNLSLYQPSYNPPPSDDILNCYQPELRDLLCHTLSSQASPRIEITRSELHHQQREHVQTAPVDISRRLAVPSYQNLLYRENLSPASSTSSSWHSEVYSPQPSPCVSPSGSGGGGLAAMTVAELCPRLQAIHASGSPHTSPNTSPRTSITEETFLNCKPSSASSSSRPGSRSTSPQGKRTYEQYQNPALVVPRSRSPSPHALREELVEPCRPPANVDEFVDSINRHLAKPVPTKIGRTFQEYSICSQKEHAVFAEVKREPIMEPVYVLQPLGLPNQMPTAMCSMSLASLPALEWPLPSCTEQYELNIEVQPRQHHRAHYETEGSRGAVKAASGGHPVVQLHGYRGREALALQVFIGTADERAMRPHAFYQVHRITGKTVTTSSQEKMLNGTKVLELLLEPKDNMRAIVDCAGILKLKNADIELRKGETDVGRKNTRVRLVFRVHVPQPGGQWISLQVSSNPIECSQRPSRETPEVRRQDLDHCSVLGGMQMILTGQNFTSESRVLFSETTLEGLEVWEKEAIVNREKSQANMLYVEIPPYRDPNIYHPVKVNFCVLNGKRKPSQPQHFTYMPLPVPPIKAEPLDEYQYGELAYSVPQVLGVSPQLCHHTAQIATSCCSMPGQVSQRTNSPILYPPSSEYHKLHQPSAFYQSQLEALSTSPGHYQPPLDQPASGVQPICSGPATAIGPNPGSHLKPSSYQHIIAGHNYQAGVSMFPSLDATNQRIFVQRAAPPLQSYNQQQPVEHQRTSSPVRVKRENLDETYLNDVNEVIRKDLINHPIDDD
ncbi:nuclear factor of activated T-cells, cytoplasmic 2 isoform X1 [Tachysurus fulvidraco]|uniref:nuclear factor of activated T-cells, cytoplasmic 2 isoform X1 n=1 Tax=Tachysurus fulvidraco TaxID=1234273 RepID=UPI000F4D704C|nr:nuclear factor of activated T-cells, cytoplasmic 2 isoform X1 [Tachysurus fulvidraco]